VPSRPAGGHVYHVLNRSAGRLTLFRTDQDFAAFQDLIAEAQQLHAIRLLAYCLMPNHWHFVAQTRASNAYSPHLYFQASRQ
jgi:putative transposase